MGFFCDPKEYLRDFFQDPGQDPVPIQDLDSYPILIQDPVQDPSLVQDLDSCSIPIQDPEQDPIPI